MQKSGLINWQDLEETENNWCIPTFFFLVPVPSPTAFPVGEFALPQQILNMMCYSALLSVQIQPALKDAQMGIMLTAVRDNVLHATAPVSLALENTAHSAFPANRAGTDKEKDAWMSVQQGKVQDFQLRATSQRELWEIRSLFSILLLSEINLNTIFRWKILTLSQYRSGGKL